MKKFYIGTDIGTNSVGVACTDEDYNLLRAKGKDCWAVRLFDEAETAEKRRTYRTNRRRLDRRKQRIKFLQELFSPFITDETFFIRLNNSQFLPEDKDALLFGDKNNLFSGEYDDKRFHEEFPTVYHLREALINGCDYDLRLYYLAIHHIVKYRGHFLFEGSLEEARDVSRLLKDLNEVISDTYGEDAPHFCVSDVGEIKKALLDENKTLKDRQFALEGLFDVDDKISKEIIKGILGAKISPVTLFDEDKKEEKSFSFKDVTDETFESMKPVYGDDFALLSAIRAIYGFVTFEKILKGYSDVSSAMIAVYEKHKNDLRLLKDFIRKESGKEYNKIFKSTKEKHNYVNYIGYTSSSGKKGNTNNGKRINVEKCKNDEEFFAYLKKFLSELPDVKDDKTRDYILSELDNGRFLPKILHSDKGLFPKQINEAELVKIVRNMVKKYPETAAIAENISVLFNFRVPYYVGPLTGVNSWAVRTEEKVTPYNFDKVVDRAKSNEEFMRKMTNKCTYLRGEDVLPKASVLYQKYDTLNQLNKLRINDRPIPVELKQKIFNELFLKYAKVSDAKIKELLVREGIFSEEEVKSVSLSGKDGEFKASMSSYIRLKKILGDEFVDKDLAGGGNVCENIILWHTLNTDKKFVVELIEKNYGQIPQIKNNIKALKGLSFSDFGRLSAKFLNGITAIDKASGEITNVTIMDVLYDTTENLNEILSDERYNFGEAIAIINGEKGKKFSYDMIDELYVSPAVRRGIRQTLLMIDEYVEAIGKAPDKIFVEVTRENGKKGNDGRTQPRKRQLQEKFRTIGEAYADVIKELGDEKCTDFELRKERLFLYFRQLGRCMYTGERIDLGELGSERYDVDHILPRKYVKDDSLDNKVLVCRSSNEAKKAYYPIPANIVNPKAREHWKLLLEKGLISKITYDRLTRTEPLNDGDFKDFINRQKVITDQTAKAVIELLKIKYPDTKLIYSKAKNINDFRNKFDLYKCRETNDLHHARDAYLNVVVGNVYNTYCAQMQELLKKGGIEKEYDVDEIFSRNVRGAWKYGYDLKTVKNTFMKPSMIVTRYATCNKGKFYNETVYKRDDKGITAPRKNKGSLADTAKYGGYKSQETAFFAIVSSVDKKGKRIKTIEAIPVLVSYNMKNDSDAERKYLVDVLKLNDPVLIVPKVKVKQLVSYNGTPCYLAGITGNQIIGHNAIQLFTDNKTDEYVRELVKLIGMKGNKSVDENASEYPTKINRLGEVKCVINRENNEKLYRMLEEKLSKNIYSGLSSAKTFGKNLETSEEKFVSLSVMEQAEVLLQILKFFKCNAEKSNLKSIEGSPNAGTILFNKDITDADFKLINLSPAGLTERVRKV